MTIEDFFANRYPLGKAIITPEALRAILQTGDNLTEIFQHHLELGCPVPYSTYQLKDGSQVIVYSWTNGETVCATLEPLSVVARKAEENKGASRASIAPS